MLEKLKENLFSDPNSIFNYLMLGAAILAFGSVLVFGLNVLTLLGTVVAPVTAGVLANKLES